MKCTRCLADAGTLTPMSGQYLCSGCVEQAAINRDVAEEMAMEQYHRCFSPAAYNEARSGLSVKTANLIIDAAMSICGHPAYRNSTIVHLLDYGERNGWSQRRMNLVHAYLQRFHTPNLSAEEINRRQ